jgi:hypothetical protein
VAHDNLPEYNFSNEARGAELHAVCSAWDIGWTDTLFVDGLIDRFAPKTESDFRLLLTLAYVAQPEYEVVLPWYLIAQCAGFGSDIYHRNYLRKENSTGEILRRFVSEYFPLSHVSPHNIIDGRARSVAGIAEAIGTELLNLRIQCRIFGSEDEMKRPKFRKSTQDINWVRHSPSGRGRLLHRRRLEAQEALPKSSDWLTPLHQKLFDYLNNLPARTFYIAAEQFSEASSYISQNYDGRKAEYRMLQLFKMRQDAVPVYNLSRSRRTARIFDTNTPLQFMPSDIRKILYPKWVEADLVQAQLRIAATDWQLPALQHFLNQPGQSGDYINVWHDIYEHMKLDKQSASFNDVKPAIKKAVYSIMYGAGRKRIIKDFEEGLSLFDLNLKNPIKAMFKHPVLKSLLKRRRHVMKWLKGRATVEDALGQRLHVNPVSLRSTLALLAQSRETWLLEPALDEAMNEARKDASDVRFRITLWQHDGFSFTCRDQSRADSIFRRLNERTLERSKPYSTQIEKK